jgi:nicotinamide-nucleotide adenylyltransferase
MRGLYIGRFQPYHLGHQATVQEIAKEVDEIVIVVGSAQVSHTLENPFTAGERLTMICSALEDLRGRCYIIPLPDVDRNAIWVSHLLSMTPPFERVYSNNPLVIQLFKEAGIVVKKPPMYSREIYSGTAIRRLMMEGKNWRNLVPEPVALFIDQVHGEERLRNVSGNDACIESLSLSV